MIVWILLGLSLLTGALTMALTQVNPEYRRAHRAALKQVGVAGVPAGCVLAVAALLMVATWTWYAIDVGDWRFAAIAWVPALFTWIGRLATRPAKGGAS
ncbi:MAG TPA: hypothetical protein VF174_15775 [Micromonosporaceae bacterium]